MMTLRRAMASREGADETHWQIGRGLRAWAICRQSLVLHRAETTIVFGKGRADALRRAAARGRLGEESAGDITDARPIESGWDEPIAWPYDLVPEGGDRGC